MNEEYQPYYSKAISEARETVRLLKQVPIGIYDDDNPYNFIQEDLNGGLEVDSNTLDQMAPTQISLEMFKISNFTATINRRLTEYKVALDTIKEELENYKQQYMKEKHGKVTEKRAEIKTSDYYLQLNYEIIKLTNICNLLQTGVDNYDRIYSSLSRHLTAMQSDFDKNNRNEGKLNKANYAQPSLKGNNSNSGNMGRRINSQ